MEKKLTADLNVVANSNLEIEYLNGDLNIIQKLDDEPNDVGGLTSAQLKAKFDESGNTIKEYINETLIPAILADDATEAARQEAEQGRVTAEQGRVSAEEARAAAETARAQNEIQRVSAEEARAAAETARQEAEQARADENTGIVARATAQANAAAGSAQTAQAAASTAAAKASDAAASQAAAAASAAAAAGSMEGAADSAAAAAGSAATAESNNKAAQSWAVGGTGSRSGEDTNNAKYWAEQAKAVVGGDFATKTEAKSYVTTHDHSSSAHSDIREALEAKEPAGTAAAAINIHNADTGAHQDIRDAINAKKTSYYKVFTSEMWAAASATEATLTIPQSEHGLSGSDVFAQVSMLVDGELRKNTWGTISTYAIMGSDGTITLHTESAFSGAVLLIV